MNYFFSKKHANEVKTNKIWFLLIMLFFGILVIVCLGIYWKFQNKSVEYYGSEYLIANNSAGSVKNLSKFW